MTTDWEERRRWLAAAGAPNPDNLVDGTVYRRVGRPRKPLSERKVPCSVSLHPAVIEYAERLGGGNLSAGLDSGMRILMQQASDSLAAIKRAAQARDQAAIARGPKGAFDD